MKSKKLLSLVLAVIMIACTMPIAYAEGGKYKVGDIIQFGSYPQSKVTDSAIKSALNAKAPAWSKWTNYGYYSGSGDYGTMKQGDWMRYVDIEHDGEKYRGVNFEVYRPKFTESETTSTYTYQDDNGYYHSGGTYWFKFESIDWRVLDPDTGFVMCESIIDSQPYSNTIYESRSSKSPYEYFNDASYTNYASDYETSSIRQWLNDDFYNTAFTDSEKEKISTTTLNNDGYYTSIGTTGYEKLDSNETKDRIFLLSYDEVSNSKYGFNSSRSARDTARWGKGSDYAQSQGLNVYRSSGSDYNGNSFWLLRSPQRNSKTCCVVDREGCSDNTVFYTPVNETSFGVRPAFCFNDIETFDHQHSYNAVVTDPTCTNQGYTTYICECGDTYVVDYTDKLSHEYTGVITTTPTHLTEGIETFTCACGDSYTEVIAKIQEHSYSETVTAPTCTAQGYTTYICACGESYISDYVDVTDHIDSNGDYKCDYNCGYEFEQPAPEVPDEPHEETDDSLFTKIIDLIKRFFDLIFSIFKK